MFAIFLLFWLGCAGAVGWAAAQRGRSAGSWLMLSLLISPLLAVLILLASPVLDAPDERDTGADGTLSLSIHTRD